MGDQVRPENDLFEPILRISQISVDFGSNGLKIAQNSLFF